MPRRRRRPPGSQGSLPLPEQPHRLAIAAAGSEAGGRHLSLPIDRLDDGSLLAHEAAANLYANARVTLGLHHGKSPVTFPISETGTSAPADAGEAKFEPPTDRHIETYRYRPMRVEMTAECIALAALRAREDLRVRKRSEELTGADWIVTSPDMNLEEGIRVEISGIELPRAPNEVTYRLAEKVRELKRGQERKPGPYPGIAVVVAIKPQDVVLERVALASENGRG